MTSDAKIQPAITGGARKAVAFDFSGHGHALRSIFTYALISQNLTGESCGKCMQHLETCLLLPEADRVLCRHV